MAELENQEQQPTEKTFTQADVDRIIGERLSREGVQDKNDIVELLHDFDFQGTPAEIKAALKVQSAAFKQQKAEQDKQAELESAKAEAEATGTTPALMAKINELEKKLSDIEAEREAKKAEIEAKVQNEVAWNKQVDEFVKDYPDVNLDELNANTKFIKFVKGKKGVPLKELYEDYIDLIGETSEEATARAVSKANRSSSSGKGNQEAGGYNLTADQKTLVDEWNENNPRNKMTYKDFAANLRK